MRQSRIAADLLIICAFFLLVFVSAISAVDDDAEDAVSPEKKDAPTKTKLTKPQSEESPQQPRKQQGENPPAQPVDNPPAKPIVPSDGALPSEGKPAVAKPEDENPLATKPVGIQAPVRSENNNQPALTLGAGLAVINTSGQVHDYLDTAVGVNVFAHTGYLADVLPIAAFAQAGYYGASSYAVQSMSFFYGQLGAGVPIDMPWDLTLLPYAAAGIHTGKFTPAVGNAGSSKFLLASFDLGAVMSYRLSREIGITIKGGWMPVLDEFVTSNFWHIGAGASYAL